VVLAGPASIEEAAARYLVELLVTTLPSLSTMFSSAYSFFPKAGGLARRKHKNRVHFSSRLEVR
jgi:hypothetical protein